MVALLNIITVVASIGAAGFWAASAFVVFPTQITSGYGGIGGSAQELGDAVRRQSRLSAIGAVFACIGALAQACAVWVSL